MSTVLTALLDAWEKASEAKVEEYNKDISEGATSRDGSILTRCAVQVVDPLQPAFHVEMAQDDDFSVIPADSQVICIRKITEKLSAHFVRDQCIKKFSFMGQLWGLRLGWYYLGSLVAYSPRLVVTITVCYLNIHVRCMFVSYFYRPASYFGGRVRPHMCLLWSNVYQGNASTWPHA